MRVDTRSRSDADRTDRSLESADLLGIPNLSGRTLLVLSSAGFSKPGLYDAAKRRGLRLVLVKEEPTWEMKYCDDVLTLNCANYDDIDRTVSAIVEFARKQRAQGVITTFDAAIPALAEVTSRLDMVGVGTDVAAVLRNKSLMRQRFAELGLPSAQSIPARTFTQVAEAAHEIGYPVIVKPIMGTGSAGVLLADNGVELRRAYDVAMQVAAEFNCTDELLVEEYLDGIEVVVDALVHDKEVLFQNITDNPVLMSGPIFQELEFITPSNLPADVVAETYTVNEKTLMGLGLTNGIAHTEIRITSEGPRLIETHPRIAGQRVPEIVLQALGVDLFGAAIEIAMGVRPNIVQRTSGYAGYGCLYSERSGVLRAIHGIDDALTAPGVFDVEITIQPGTEVKPLPEANQQNVGYVLTKGPGYDSVHRRTKAAMCLIDLDVT